MERSPEFSLVVMTYERPAALERCLESLCRIDSAPGSFEVVVIDDGTAADQAECVRRFATRLSIAYHRVPHAGVAAARNRGIERSAGAFVGFLADDYVLPSSYLARARDHFRRFPDADLVTFNLRSCGTHFARHVQDLYFQLVLLGNAGADADESGVIRSRTLPASRAAIFRREVFSRVGPFDETMKGGEDGEMATRLAEHGIAQHFLTDVFIEHWEEKSFADFLRQRREYATSFYELWRRQLPPGPVPARWTLAACRRAVTDRMKAWWGLSRRAGCFARFLALSPGLALFLATFFFTLHRHNRRDLRCRPGAASDRR